MLGLYIHVPFCKRKCAYCDFYSLTTENYDEYRKALVREIKFWGQKDTSVDTIYFGGGTPNLLGAENLSEILFSIRENFTVTGDCEITIEANPETVDYDFFLKIRKAGFNRLSMGVQAEDEKDLETLFRAHTKRQCKSAVFCAKEAGFDNISLDLMLGISSLKNLDKSINFCKELNPCHISAYILKIEEDTPFYKMREKLDLPDEEECSRQYEFMVKRLEDLGYIQYEISNFSIKGFESRHNLKYWKCEEYLGIGPSAHSFFNKTRFYYPRDLEEFIRNPQIILDGKGGDFYEYAMLKLRLTKGLSLLECKNLGYEKEFLTLIKNAKKIPPHLINLSDEHINLTKDGFLLSNSIISSLI